MPPYDSGRKTILPAIVSSLNQMQIKQHCYFCDKEFNQAERKADRATCQICYANLYDEFQSLFKISYVKYFFENVQSRNFLDRMYEDYL